MTTNTKTFSNPTEAAKVMGAANKAERKATLPARMYLIECMKALPHKEGYLERTGPDYTAFLDLFKAGYIEGCADSKEQLANFKLDRKVFTDMPDGADKAAIAKDRQTLQNRANVAWAAFLEGAGFPVNPASKTAKVAAKAAATKKAKRGTKERADDKTHTITVSDAALFEALKWAASAGSADFLKWAAKAMPQPK